MNLNLVDLRASLVKKGAGMSELGMNNLHALKHSRKYKIKKDRTEVNTNSVHLYPYQIFLDFNPLNLEDSTYSREQPFIFKWSCTTSCKLLLAEMKNNPQLAKYLCERANVDIKELKLETLDVEKVKFTNDMGDKNIYWRLFEPYRNLLPVSANVQNFKYTAFGKFGRKYRSKVTLDVDGSPVGKLDLGYKLYQLEVALTSSQVDRIRKSYDQGGKNYGAPTADMNKEISNTWKGMAVQNPYLLGTLRYLSIKTDDEYMVSDGEAKKIVKGGGKGLCAYEKWGSGNLNEIAKLEGYIGKKPDIYFDFLEVGVGYPAVDDPGEQGEALVAYQRRDMNNNPTDRIGKVIPNIETIYREFRDDTDIFNEAVMLRSVNHYRVADDSVLLSAAKDHIQDKVKFVTKEILESHNDLLQQIDSSLSETLLDKLVSDELPDGNSEVDLDDLTRETELTPGSGILQEEEDNLNVEDDIDKEIREGIDLEGDL